MKILLSLLTVLVISQFLQAQKIIEKPRFGFSSASYVEIQKIEIADSATIVSFYVRFTPGNWISIPKQTYIQPVGSSEKLYVTKSEGIVIEEQLWMPPSGEVTYSLYFPAVSSSTKLLDFGEGNNEGNWFIYDIELEKSQHKSLVDASFLGNWFATDGSRDLIIAIYDSVAIYNSRVWKYSQVKSLKKGQEIQLKSGDLTETMHLSSNGSSGIDFTLAGRKKMTLENLPKLVSTFKLENDAAYNQPVFKKDGKAKYSGIIRNYNIRYMPKSGQIHVNNVITGSQETYLVPIASDGTFSIDIPLYYPHPIFSEMPQTYEAIVLEPGKETFHIINPSDQTKRSLFMGEMAGVNADYIALNDIRYFDYNKMQKEILDMTKEQYKNYCFEMRDKELDILNKRASSTYISSKALQLKKYDIIYSAINNSMEYEWTFENAYRQKNNIPRSQRELGVTVEKLDSAYLSMLTNELAHDPIALISNDYNNFVNRVKYLDLIRNSESQTTNLTQLPEILTAQGVTLTSDELNLIEKYKLLEVNNAGTTEKWKTFNEKYQETLSKFWSKNIAQIDKYQQDGSFVFWHDLESWLTKNGTIVTPEESEIIEAAKQIESREEALKTKEFFKGNETSIQTIWNKYNKHIALHNQQNRDEYTLNKMKALWGIEQGLLTDIMRSQDICRMVVEEASPMELTDLIVMLEPIKNQSITDYVVWANEMTKQKLEANKLKTGYFVNQTPSVESDALFDSMMAKFKGKVVFVDFWATWCGPCRSGNERIKPLKEELADKNIVFVYITNETSPRQTWENMITDIKGEHFKLSRDEWNVLSAKFGISGIPHYVLVDKNGVVAKNNGMPNYNNDAMKKLFEEFMNK